MTHPVESTAANFECVTVTVGDHVEHVATVTLDRPNARNAMNARLRQEFSDALDAIEDSDVRVVVVTGSAKSESFAAGADIQELKKRSALEQREQSKRPRVYEHIEQLRQPVIARVNGMALGGGCELAMACDIRVAHDGSKVGLPEITLGLIPGGGGTQRLTRLVGEGQAMRLILTGDVLDATKAADLGLLDIVCDEDALNDKAYGLAERMAAHSPIALEFAKRAIKASGQLGMKDGIDYEAELFAQVLASEDATEGIEAFLEDRNPDWQGR